MYTRVNYFERQFLRTQDFRDEQAYHIAMRRRHNVAHHTWGIVRGLELLSNEDGIFLQPGLAIDGYGRELLLAERRTISTSVFEDIGSDLVDVFLSYGRSESDSPPRGYVDCDPECASNNYYRSQERVNIRWVRADPEADPRCPREVLPGDLSFNPARQPPDSPLVAWPVFVGRLARDAEGKISALVAGRPYAGLVGEVIHTPTRQARLVVGQELPGKAPDEDGRRFAVYLRAPDDDPCGVPSPEVAQLEITTRRKGHEVWRTQVNLRGATTVDGDVAIVRGALSIEAVAPPPANAQPWRVYRITEKVKKEDNQAETKETEETIHEMRIEMPAKTSQVSQVVIGAWSPDDKKFVPCLTVTNECAVIVHGKLIAEKFVSKVDVTSKGGASGIRDPLKEAPEPQFAYIHPAGLTPAAQSAVSGMLATGITSSLFKRFVLGQNVMATPVTITQAAPLVDDTVSVETWPEDALAEALENLAAMVEMYMNIKPDLLNEVLSNRPQLTDKMRKSRSLMTERLGRVPKKTIDDRDI